MQTNKTRAENPSSWESVRVYRASAAHKFWKKSWMGFGSQTSEDTLAVLTTACWKKVLFFFSKKQFQIVPRTNKLQNIHICQPKRFSDTFIFLIFKKTKEAKLTKFKLILCYSAKSFSIPTFLLLASIKFFFFYWVVKADRNKHHDYVI